MSKKHQPQELSSKQPVSVLRQVVSAARRKAHDPRFDRNFGHYNEELFKKSYAFLQEVQQREMAQLEAQLKKERNGGKAELIKSIIEKRKNRERAQERLETDKKILREVRKRDLEKVEAGVKRPFYLKKSQQKALLQHSRRAELLESSQKTEGQLRKIAERKLKKRASKQKRKLPWEN